MEQLRALANFFVTPDKFLELDLSMNKFIACTAAVKVHFENINEFLVKIRSKEEK